MKPRPIGAKSFIGRTPTSTIAIWGSALNGYLSETKERPVVRSRKVTGTCAKRIPLW